MIISQQTISNLQKGRFNTHLIANKKKIPVQIFIENKRMFFNFSYYAPLIDEVKESFENREYHGFKENDGRKIWSAPLTYRNLFQLEALQGNKPYLNWHDHEDRIPEVIDYCNERFPDDKIYNHQIDLVAHALSNHWVIWAAEMGTGKTLASIILMEMINIIGTPFYCGSKSSLVSVKLEFQKWQSKLEPDFMTYDGLKKRLANWDENNTTPNVVIFDESSLCKNPKADRSQAALYLANNIRGEYGFDNSYIILMSGTPAPKKPTDWWQQCEIACPGFLREQNWYLFRNRLGVFKEEDNGAGAFPKLVTWKDNDELCDVCGQNKNSIEHAVGDNDEPLDHYFKPMRNEVAFLHQRFKGLVNVKFKKDCLDLPEKRYKTYTLQPTQEMLNMASSIIASSSRAADALIKLRSLADGFIYKDEVTDETIVCPGCEGNGKQVEFYCDEEEHLLQDEIEGKFLYEYDEEGDIINTKPIILKERLVSCHQCKGERRINKIIRTELDIKTPKETLLKTLLDEHEECGRLNVYAGFTGSINKITRICHSKGWSTIRADGRGWEFTDPSNIIINIKPEEMLLKYDKAPMSIAFVGQPGAAGMGLTLTASPSTFFYSNDFNPQSRRQAEDRGHRPGMDLVRGGYIIDCVVLPSDEKVLTSLKKSERLQKMSMTGLKQLYS